MKITIEFNLTRALKLVVRRQKSEPKKVYYLGVLPDTGVNCRHVFYPYVSADCKGFYSATELESNGIVVPDIDKINEGIEENQQMWKNFCEELKEEHLKNLKEECERLQARYESIAKVQRTVKVNFPYGWKFPEKYEYNACNKCPFMHESDTFMYEGYCPISTMVEGDEGADGKYDYLCPFYGKGADEVVEI